MIFLVLGWVFWRFLRGGVGLCFRWGRGRFELVYIWIQLFFGFVLLGGKYLFRFRVGVVCMIDFESFWVCGFLGFFDGVIVG